eukprot:9238582-Pyramimonas_sp.AAC.1
MAPRRLPVWHAPSTLWRQCNARWSEWSRCVRPALQVLRAGRRVRSERRAHATPAGAPPPDWSEQETRAFRVGDDRGPSKAWIMGRA